jgi:hypothetical protein
VTRAARVVADVAGVRHDGGVTVWEYARLEYQSTGSFGTDKNLDWAATFHHPGGIERWGTDEKFGDLRHLNRAGAQGWQAYHRAAMMIGQPQRLYSVTYSFRRAVN